MGFRMGLLGVVFFAALPADAQAPAARERLLVPPAWLSSHLNDHDLVLLHLGSAKEYGPQHIPGARQVALDDVSADDAPGSLSLEMPPPDTLRAKLASLGISDASRIVVYFTGDHVSPATRLVFTLDYAGLGDRTSLLDGGLQAWKKAGGAVTSVATPPRTGTLSPLKIRPIVIDAATVRAEMSKPGVAIVDGRARSYYDGLERGGMPDAPQPAGHIAGARSVPFNTLLDDDMRLRSAAELADLFARAGVKPDDSVIGYCHIGQQATTMLLAARTLGHAVRLYDGSFEDWSRHPGYPVELTGKRGTP
ncbi:MAG TPA: rhodanese-like domain-containing protein [Polyangiaceae bacterium]|jgi:thiosulfate/3-mercaptopyruvate sulfurtransferase